MLQIDLLGRMRVTLDGGAPFPMPSTPKYRALLAYLVVESGQGHRRDMLAALLWPNQSQDLARQSLRQALSHLRRVFDPVAPVLVTDSATVRFDLACDHRLDCLVLLDALGEGEPSPLCRAGREAALAAYRGPFLEDVTVADCPEFDEWKSRRREDFDVAARTIGERLVACCVSSGDFAAALGHARRGVALDPWSDRAWRSVIHLTALTQGRAAALAAYGEFRGILKRELDAEPDGETLRLARDLRDDRVPPLSAACPCRGGKPAAAPPPEAGPVRRLVTVLYCAVVLPSDAEPDMLLDASTRLRALAAPILRRHGGHELDLVFDGVMASFGYPSSDERAALSAVHAARALCAAAPEGVDVRAGLAAGVVIGQAGKDGLSLVGQAPKAALTMFAQAPLGGVALDETVRDLVRAAIRCDLLAKGAYAVSGAAADDDGDVAPLVGRDAEMADLRAAWEQARAGSGRAVLISGDPGMGKSRLTRELRRHIGARATWWVCQCVRQFQESPEAALAELVGRLAAIEPSDDEAGRLAKIEGLAEASGAGRAHAAALAALIGAGEEEGRDADGWKPWWRAFLALLAAQARRGPVVLAVEDLHWADASTVDMLQAVLGALSGHAVMVLLTTRPSFEPAWLLAAARPAIRLAPLAEDRVREMVRGLGGGLEPALVEAIVERAAGIPFFAEELVRAVLRDPAIRVPNSLENLLVGQFETLGPARRVAVVASVIGATIDGALLRHLAERGCGIAQDSLRQDIDRLVARGVLVRHASDWFSFRHALIQDAAYGTLPAGQRQELHRAVAAALAERFPHLGPPEILARHHGAAGDFAAALAGWEQAARRAMGRHADAEAASHSRLAIEALSHLPPGPERDARELRLQLTLAEALIAPSFYGAADLGRAYARALELSEGLGDDQTLFPALRGMWSFYMRCDIDTACELAARLLRLAEAAADAIKLFHAHYANGNALYWAGRLDEAQRHLDRALALDAAIDWSGVEQVSRFDRAAARIFHALTLLYRGHEAEAADEAERFINWARGQDHPHTLVFVIGCFAGFALTRRDFATAQAHCAEVAAVSESHGFAFWTATAKILGGAALRSAEGYRLMRQGFEERAGMGQSDAISYAFLADCAQAAGLWQEGLAAAEMALELAERRHDMHYVPEVLRLKALLLRDGGLGREGEARELMAAARDMARAQGAVLFEQRAALDLV